MKRSWLVLVVLLAALAFPGRAAAAPLADDEVVAGGVFVLEDGEVLEGSLLIVGGDVQIEAGAEIEGNVLQLSGTAAIAGLVEGNVTQFGGSLTLEPTAYVEGDVHVNGGAYQREDGAQVDGEVVLGWRGPDGDHDRPRSLGEFLLDGLWSLFALFSTAALAVLVAILWPKQLAVIGQAIEGNPIMAGGVGLLTVGVIAPLLALAALTLILIPISFVGILLLAVAGGFGWIALANEIGKRIGQLAKQDWAPGLSAGVGALLLGIVYAGIGEVPCVGWAMQTMVSLIGLGAVTLTWFGSSEYEKKDEG